MDSMTEKMRKAYGEVVDKLRPKEPGKTVTIEAAKGPLIRPELHGPPAERFLHSQSPRIAEKLYTAPPAPEPQPRSKTPSVYEKPTKLDHVPYGRRGPTLATPGSDVTYTPAPPIPIVSTQPVVPKKPLVIIEPLERKSARSSDPQPSERLAATISHSPREALLALAKSRLKATQELDRQAGRDGPEPSL